MSVVPKPIPMSTSPLQTVRFPSVGCKHGGSTMVDCKVHCTSPVATLATGTRTSPGKGVAHWERHHWSKVPSSKAGVPGGVGAPRAPPKKKVRSQTPRPVLAPQPSAGTAPSLPAAARPAAMSTSSLQTACVAVAECAPPKTVRSQTPRPVWAPQPRRARRRCYRRSRDPPPCQRRHYRRRGLPAQRVAVEPRRRVAPRPSRAPWQRRSSAPALHQASVCDTGSETIGRRLHLPGRACPTASVAARTQDSASPAVRRGGHPCRYRSWCANRSRCAMWD